MEQAKSKTTINPNYNGKNRTAPLHRLLSKDGDLRRDKESKASSQTQIEGDEAKNQTLKEQAKNKTAVGRQAVSRLVVTRLSSAV